MSTMITGMFDNRRDAERATDALLSLGVTRDNISLIVNEQARAGHFDNYEDEHNGNKAGEGAGAGAAIGGTLGAIAGALALTAGNLFLPGVGLLVAGPALAALAGAGAGGAAGTLVGALVGMGIPEEEAAHYEEGLREGRILLGATVPDQLAEKARNVFQWDGAQQPAGYGRVA